MKYCHLSYKINNVLEVEIQVLYLRTLINPYRLFDDVFICGIIMIGFLALPGVFSMDLNMVCGVWFFPTLYGV
jgi:hypothetical protein